jgi:hypothetical protein
MEQPLRTPSNLNVYEQSREQMKTGDVIAFSGKAGFSSLIKWATNSPYSHVGMVLTAHLGGGFGESVLIIESTTETDLTDVDNRQVIKGVQLHWLSKRIKMYEGEVFWVPLKDPLPPEGSVEMEAWLRKTHNQKVPYDSVQVMGAGLDLFERLGLGNQPDFSKLFCSELVARALQIAGVVDPNLSASEQTPKDVVDFPCLQAPILLKES